MDRSSGIIPWLFFFPQILFGRDTSYTELLKVGTLAEPPPPKVSFYRILYSGTPTLLFKDVHAPIINMDKDKVTYIDVGCGKGRVLIQALDAGFKNLIGVEFVPDIAAQSRDNMALAIGKLNDDAQKSINCQIISQDIRQYKYPNTPLILYLFNPFDPIIFQAFMDNLLKDLAENPRPMTLIYSNAHCQDILDACQELRRLEYSPLARLKLKCLSSHSYGAWEYIL